MKIPIIADFTKKIATDYGVLKEDEGRSSSWHCALAPV